MGTVRLGNECRRHKRTVGGSNEENGKENSDSEWPVGGFVVFEEMEEMERPAGRGNVSSLSGAPAPVSCKGGSGEEHSPRVLGVPIARARPGPPAAEREGSSQFPGASAVEACFFSCCRLPAVSTRGYKMLPSCFEHCQRRLLCHQLTHRRAVFSDTFRSKSGNPTSYRLEARSTALVRNSPDEDPLQNLAQGSTPAPQLPLTQGQVASQPATQRPNPKKRMSDFMEGAFQARLPSAVHLPRSSRRAQLRGK
jgi:hypothetical protein